LRLCYKTCANVLVSKSSAKNFQERLEEVASIIKLAWQQHSSNKVLLNFIEELQVIVQDATTKIAAYTELSYFEKLLLGTIPSEEFQDLDNRIKAKLSDMVTALSIVGINIGEKTFEGVQDILHQLGGLEAIVGRKLDDFFARLGMKLVGDLHLSVIDILFALFMLQLPAGI
jgi:chemotaxis regulatin CheY-phosphate phosphatase CheZ